MLYFVNTVTFFDLIESISPIVYSISAHDLFLPGLILSCGVFIIMSGLTCYSGTRIGIPDLLNDRDITPKLSTKGKEKENNPENLTVDLSYTISTSPSNVSYRLVIDVLDSAGNNLKALYPRPSIAKTPCTFNGQAWVGLKFSGSSFQSQHNSSSELFKETSYTYSNLALPHMGCWAPRPNVTNTSTQNTRVLSAASAAVYSADGRNVFVRKQ